MVKEKPNSTRIYDKDGFRQRAACICVRSDDENEVSARKFTFARPFVVESVKHDITFFFMSAGTLSNII